MKRNLLYLEKKFKSENFAIIETLKSEVKKYLKQCLLYNGSFWKTFKYLKKAESDFIDNKMGKIDAEF